MMSFIQERILCVYEMSGIYLIGSRTGQQYWDQGIFSCREEATKTISDCERYDRFRNKSLLWNRNLDFCVEYQNGLNVVPFLSCIPQGDFYGIQKPCKRRCKLGACNKRSLN
jgi:hypothetical protein